MWMFQTGKMANNDFYLRYYVGHKGKFGHEFLEFEFRPDGKLRLTSHANSFLAKDARKIILGMPTTATTRTTQ